jgi:hypothetical protein
VRSCFVDHCCVTKCEAELQQLSVAFAGGVPQIRLWPDAVFLLCETLRSGELVVYQQETVILFCYMLFPFCMCSMRLPELELLHLSAI